MVCLLWIGIPRLYAAASLKRPAAGFRKARSNAGIPRLYAAASLKPESIGHQDAKNVRYSAALCRGLIEAAARPTTRAAPYRYSAALCRGLIEANTN